MGVGFCTAAFLCRAYLHLFSPNHEKCVGIHDSLYVGVFSYDMGYSTSTTDKENKNGYHGQSDYAEGQQLKNHRTVLIVLMVQTTSGFSYPGSIVIYLSALYRTL